MGRKDEYVSITLPSDTKDRIRGSAVKNGRSLTQEIRIAIDEYLKNHEDMVTIFDETKEIYTGSKLVDPMTIEEIETLIKKAVNDAVNEQRGEVNKK